MNGTKLWITHDPCVDYKTDPMQQMHQYQIVLKASADDFLKFFLWYGKCFQLFTTTKVQTKIDHPTTSFYANKTPKIRLHNS